MNLSESSPLGKKSIYSESYDSSLLFSIVRSRNRAQIGIKEKLPFNGCDVWNAYELSWLNEKGKPIVAIGKLVFPCESPNLVESKSLKLYLNSFNNTRFNSTEKVVQILTQDLSRAAGMPVQVEIAELNSVEPSWIGVFQGICLDELDIECEHYQIEPDYLTVSKNPVFEVLYSHLLKSNCLVTNQPDWGSVQIIYKGNKINHEGLLKYLISFRQHNEFHEPCVERIFVDIMRRCQPSELTIYARYTRRGGLDINPWRSTLSCDVVDNLRLLRQ
ncbi:MAG: NADPH-dependent 7-cyano-7-deazaguanine reductase QueF [Coxiella sp. RIFCSPHIGHO2_12_FULL_42_15]|nr:MAG: NADPH-dependent 7-cyano-7-deazaguanine reductase QueF [Coxiella sp. RIFCSPHIGHO2_12_FULL_42_15]